MNELINIPINVPYSGTAPIKANQTNSTQPVWRTPTNISELSNRSKKRTCGFFKWANEVDNVVDLQMLAIEKDTNISELEYERDVLKGEVKRP
ncbi:DNA topoisomerase 3-alpha [Bienertia sinuspersici]